MKLEPGATGPALAQLALGVMTLMAVAPLDGQPIAGSALNRLHATPLAAGTLRGSWIVDGDRRHLAGLWSKGIVVLAAPEAIRGGPASGELGNA